MATTTSIVGAGDAASYVENRGEGNASLPSDGGDLFAGGPGLHLLWRDPINGTIGHNTPAHQACLGTLPSRPKTNAPVDSEMRPGPNQLFDAATVYISDAQFWA
jgi:hypothetical protein